MSSKAVNMSSKAVNMSSKAVKEQADTIHGGVGSKHESLFLELPNIYVGWMFNSCVLL